MSSNRSVEYKIQKYLKKMGDVQAGGEQFGLYLKKLNYYYEQLGGVIAFTQKATENNCDKECIKQGCVKTKLIDNELDEWKNTTNDYSIKEDVYKCDYKPSSVQRPPKELFGLKGNVKERIRKVAEQLNASANKVPSR